MFRRFSVVLFLGFVAFVMFKIALVGFALVGLVLGLPLYGVYLSQKIGRSKSHREWEQREFSRIHPECLGPDWLPPNAPPRKLN